MARKNFPGALRLFEVFGITVYLHYLWFLLLAYVLVSKTGVGVYEHSFWHLAEILSLFGIVLFHEFGHALACRSVGGEAKTILLWPLGGIAFVQPPMRPGAWLWSLAAGPLMNVLLLPVTFGALYLIHLPTVQVPQDVGQYVLSVTIMNVVILGFNLLPIYPLDGGQMLHAILWFFIGFAKALRVVAILGIIAAVILAVLFYRVGNYYGLLIAAFIGWQSVRGYRLAQQVSRSERPLALQAEAEGFSEDRP